MKYLTSKPENQNRQSLNHEMPLTINIGYLSGLDAAKYRKLVKRLANDD